MSRGDTVKELLKSIPKVDTLLTHNELKGVEKSLLIPLINSHLDSLRNAIRSGHLNSQSLNEALKNLVPTLKAKVAYLRLPTLKRVINATGVVIHTNLGRSVFSTQILDEITPFLCSYHTLEYDINEGKRSERYKHCTQMLCELCGCEDALLVNNNAAAVFLILNTFSSHKEVIISRGELVEIGGSFRIPEVMLSASSILHEVGTTNKTRLQDYINAINEQSAMIMKVHQSNFKQTGFVESCHLKDIISLARRHNLIDYFDLGSGHMGIIKFSNEPSVQEICSYKPSLMSFSGDKLLGAGQIGIILGKKHLIDKLKANQIIRALRVDKFSILALNATLKAYKDKAYHKIPTLAMLSLDSQTLKSKALSFKKLLCDSSVAKKLDIEMIPLHSVAGGGSIPHINFDSYGIAIRAKKMSIDTFEIALRKEGLIACIKGENILIDMRTLLDGDEEAIIKILDKVLNEK